MLVLLLLSLRDYRGDIRKEKRRATIVFIVQCSSDDELNERANKNKAIKVKRIKEREKGVGRSRRYVTSSRCLIEFNAVFEKNMCTIISHVCRGIDTGKVKENVRLYLSAVGGLSRSPVRLIVSRRQTRVDTLDHL